MTVQTDNQEACSVQQIGKDADLDAYEILVHQHESMLHGYLMSLVRDPHIAEDVAQQAFVIAFRKLSSLKNRNAFGSWLRTIARNLAFRRMKRDVREVPMDPDVVRGMEDVFRPFDPPVGDTRTTRVSAVKQCFEKLPEMVRETCALHYMSDMKTKDVAAKLETSLSAVLKRLERGRSMLRKCVERTLNLEGIQ